MDIFFASLAGGLSRRDARREFSAGMNQALYSSWKIRTDATPSAFDAAGISQAFKVLVTLQRDARRRNAAGNAGQNKNVLVTKPTRRRQLVIDWKIGLLQGSSYRI